VEPFTSAAAHLNEVLSDMPIAAAHAWAEESFLNFSIRCDTLASSGRDETHIEKQMQ
jgi:hypothetical protein